MTYEDYTHAQEDINDTLCAEHARKFDIPDVYEYMDTHDILACDEMPCNKGCPLTGYATR